MTSPPAVISGRIVAAPPLDPTTIRRNAPPSGSSPPPPIPSRISDAVTEALPDLVEALFGPFAKALLRICRPYLPNIVDFVSTRFRLIDAVSPSDHYHPVPQSGRQEAATPARRAAKTFVAMAISHLVSRRFGVGCMGMMLFVWGGRYAEAMEIKRGGVMAGLREAAFWEMGMAWVGICCKAAGGGKGGAAVFILASMQVMCIRDVAMEEGQVYLVNDEPLATRSALWMSLCCMCYYLPKWFAAALVLTAWLLVAAAAEEAAAAGGRFRQLASLVSAHKMELLRNTTAGVGAVMALATRTSASFWAFLLCLPLTFCFFYASMTPEHFLANAATLPLAASMAMAAQLCLPWPPQLGAAVVGGWWAAYVMSGEDKWAYQAGKVKAWRRRAQQIWSMNWVEVGTGWTRESVAFGSAWAAAGGPAARMGFLSILLLLAYSAVHYFIGGPADLDISALSLCILLPTYLTL